MAERGSLAVRVRESVFAVLLMVATALVVFSFFQRELASSSMRFTYHPDIRNQLEASREDQRLLAEGDPDHEATYRARFGELQTTLQRLRVLEHNRERLEVRYQLLLLAIFILSVVVSTGFFAWRQARHGPRLRRLGEALEALARGETDLQIDESGRDTIARIATMIEETSVAIGKDRRRLASLENLSNWQDATRRLAHEMKTPLTSAKLELGRIEALLERSELSDIDPVMEAVEGAGQELQRLAEFSRRFAGFARLPDPSLVARDLAQEMRGFVETFAEAWPQLSLRLHAPAESWAWIDRDLLRQVWVNLCDNSAQALGEGGGQIVFTIYESPEAIFLDVVDDGPGVPPEMRERLFEPYVSTQAAGQGMGLGLAISRKILLDHGGDLELAESSEEGTRMLLVLQKAEAP